MWYKEVMESIRRFLRKVNLRPLGSLCMSGLRLWARITRRIPSGRARLLVANLQPLNPLGSGTEIPAIEIVVPFVEKDQRLVQTVVLAAVKHSLNRIVLVRLITPDPTSKAVMNLVESLKKEIKTRGLMDTRVRAESDESVLGPELFEELRNEAGWNKQQLIKFAAVLKSSEVGSLVVDADTVLLRDKSFLGNNGEQLLQVGEVYRNFYEGQFSQFFSLTKRTPVMFITHHQLMQKFVVQRMFPGGAGDLAMWLKLSLQSPHRRLTEYDSYGSFLELKFNRRVRYGSWGNTKGFDLGSKIESGGLPGYLKNLSDHYCSVSFHAYDQNS